MRLFKSLLLVLLGASTINAQTFDFDWRDLEYSLGGQISTSFLTAPSQEGSGIGLDPTSPEVGQSYLQSNNLGIAVQWQIDPIQHDYISYRYSQEWSYGLGIGTSYSYQLRGHEISLGVPALHFVFHAKNRDLNVLGQTSQDVSTTRRHQSNYTDISRLVFGLRTSLDYDGIIMLGFIQESFNNIEADPWSGVMFRLEYPEAWGAEVVLFWAHPAQGRIFFDPSVVPQTEDLIENGLFLNVKLNYRIAYSGRYYN